MGLKVTSKRIIAAKRTSLYQDCLAELRVQGIITLCFCIAILAAYCFNLPSVTEIVKERQATAKYFATQYISNKYNSSQQAILKQPEHQFLVKKIQQINPNANEQMLANIIVSEAKKQKVDPLIIASVITSESSFQTGAISYAGARGLMQLMPRTAKELLNNKGMHWSGLNKLHDPKQNVALGISYLSYLENKFKGNKKLALMAYNWGPGNIDKTIKRRKKVIKPVNEYAKKILNRYNRWKIELSNNSIGQV